MERENINDKCNTVKKITKGKNQENKLTILEYFIFLF